MDLENGAQGAPRKGPAYSPTGFRRLTPGLLKVDRTAESFAGLPDGVTAHGQLLAALKAAAPRLGLSTRLVHAVDWLFKFTQPQDWERGGRPIVWPSALLQQEALGLSETQAKRLNRCLIEAGLVTMKDSPNGKRYGKRDPKGRIMEAYGFELSPLAARYAEFVRRAEEGRAERETMGRLRRRATIARKGIVQILETACDYGLEGEEWGTLERDAQAIVQALKRAERPDDMEAGVTSLEQRQRAARARLEMLLKNVKTIPSEVENEPHQYTYNRTLRVPILGTRAPKEAGERFGARDPSGRAGEAYSAAEVLSAATEPDLAGDHRCGGLAAARPRRVEIAVGRCLRYDGPGSGRDRAGDRFDQGPGTFPHDAWRLLPRDGAKGQGRRTAPRAYGVGAAARR
jgi:Replication protein C N-terminal domain